MEVVEVAAIDAAPSSSVSIVDAESTLDDKRGADECRDGALVRCAFGAEWAVGGALRVQQRRSRFHNRQLRLRKRSPCSTTCDVLEKAAQARVSTVGSTTEG